MPTSYTGYWSAPIAGESSEGQGCTPRLLVTQILAKMGAPLALLKLPVSGATEWALQLPLTVGGSPFKNPGEAKSYSSAVFTLPRFIDKSAGLGVPDTASRAITFSDGGIRAIANCAEERSSQDRLVALAAISGGTSASLCNARAPGGSSPPIASAFFCPTQHHQLLCAG